MAWVSAIGCCSARAFSCQVAGSWNSSTVRAAYRKNRPGLLRYFQANSAAFGSFSNNPETAPDEAPLEIGEVRIEFPKRSVRVRGGDAQLTYVEFEILSALARAPGRVFTRDMLLARIWGDSAYRDPRTIDVHIRHLREKIERDPKDPEYLFTVRGVGYRFRDTEL